jgi:glycosyltransferase involved in cell wall biosynthesis
MRVGFDARWYNDSGVGSYIAGLLPALVHAGCEMVIYVDLKNLLPELSRLSVKVVRIRAGKYSPFASSEFQARAKKDKLDLFHSPFYVMPKLRCPVIVTIHDLIPFLFPIYPRWKRAMVKAGYRSAARRAAHVIVDSQNTAKDVQNILKVASEKVTSIHLAAAQESFRPCAKEWELGRLAQKFGVSQPYFVAASACNWRTKNLQGALAALTQAQSNADTQFQTVIYGSPEGLNAANHDGEALQKLNARHVGHIATEDLAALFRHAHGFIMPSLYEGFGLPLVEAMACGSPVITSNGGSLPEVAAGGAQCFDPQDVSGMAAAIVKLLRSPEELERRREEALKRSADFSWTKAALETMAVYHQVFNRT